MKWANGKETVSLPERMVFDKSLTVFPRWANPTRRALVPTGDSFVQVESMETGYPEYYVTTSEGRRARLVPILTSPI